jgi:arabinogalactan endo-1,4-beta-galactosidase
VTYSQMLDAVYGYVSHSCNIIKYYGVTPAWVKIGNESNSGICKPVGSISHPDQMTGLLNAVYDMSKQVFPGTPVLVHLAQPQNLSSIQTFGCGWVAAMLREVLTPSVRLRRYDCAVMTAQS